MLVAEHLYIDGCLKGMTFLFMDILTYGLGYGLEP